MVRFHSLLFHSMPCRRMATVGSFAADSMQLAVLDWNSSKGVPGVACVNSLLATLTPPKVACTLPPLVGTQEPLRIVLPPRKQQAHTKANMADDSKKIGVDRQ
jgi:hypothetical protein